MELSNNRIALKKLTDDQIEASKLIAIMNHKGGCGKSSLCDAIAHWLIGQGHNTLIIDNDPQCNITQRLGIISDEDLIDRRVNEYYDALTKPRIADKTVGLPVSVIFPPEYKNGGVLGLLAGSDQAEYRAALAYKLLGNSESVRKFKERIELYRNYFEFIIIDTAPSIHNNSINELTVSVADEIIIPFDSSEAIMGLSNFMEWIKRVTAQRPPNVLFAMTKWHADTKDFQNLCMNSLITKKHYEPDENKCAMFRIMKKLVGNSVCNNGIVERKILRTHSYTGLKNSYDMKKKYDALSEEIYKKIRTPRENTIDYWFKNGIREKLIKELEPIEATRNRGVVHSFGTFQFRDLNK